MKYLVYIVESPSSENFLSGRAEGQTLSQVLNLDGIQNQYRVAIDGDAFGKAMKLFANDIKLKRSQSTERWIPIVTSHVELTEEGSVFSECVG